MNRASNRYWHERFSLGSFGRAPSQSLGVALSAVLLARSSLRGAASIAHAKCTLPYGLFIPFPLFEFL